MRGIQISLVRVVILILPLFNFVWGARLRYALSLPISSATDGSACRGIADAVRLSVQDINEKVAIPNGHEIELTVLDSDGTSAGEVKNVFLAAPPVANNIAVISGWDAEAFGPSALSAQNLDMYICSGSVTSAQLNDNDLYTTMMRLIPSDDRQGFVLAYFLKYMEWTSCAFLGSSTTYGRDIGEKFINTANMLKMFISTIQYADMGTSDELPITEALHAIADSGVRIVIFIGDKNEFVRTSAIARKMNLIGPGWSWVGSDRLDGIEKHPQIQADSQLVQGLFFATPYEFVNKDTANTLLSRIQAQSPHVTALERYSGYYIDCIKGLTIMFSEMVKSGISSDDIMNRNAVKPIKQVIKNFEGVSGNVYFDQNGGRLGRYSITNISKLNASMAFEITSNGTVILRQNPQFSDYTSTKPMDVPDTNRAFLIFPDPIALFVVFICALFGILIMASTCVILRNSTSPVVRESNIWVMTSSAVGMCIILLSALAWIGEQTILKCQIPIVGINTGFELVVVPFLYRTFVTWTLFENPLLKTVTDSTRIRTLAFLGILLIQPILLFAWLTSSPLVPHFTATRDNYSYTCYSDNSAVQVTFKWILIAWNTTLLLSLLYLARETRILHSPIQKNRFMYMIAVNIVISCAVLSPIIVFYIPGFMLGSYWIHMAVIISCITFVWTCSHGLALKLIYRPRLDATSTSGFVKSSKTRSFTNNSNKFLPSIINNKVVSEVLNVNGRMSFSGEFPAKFTGYLQTWRKCRILFALSGGYFGVTYVTSMSSAGKVWDTKHVTAVVSKSLDMVVEIKVKSKTQVLIQFRSNEQVENILQLFSSQGKPPIPNQTQKSVMATDELSSIE